MINRSQIFRLLQEKKSAGLGNILFSEFASLHGQLQTPVAIENVVTNCGIGLENHSLSANGYLVCDSEGYKIIVNKNRPEPLKRFTIAHELAHWFLRQTVGIDDNTDLGRAEKEVLERVCDHFASRLLAPDYAIVREINRNSKGLSIPILERVAAIFRVPLRAVITSLRSSGILNATEMAVVVLKPMSNPSTGAQWDIRLWQTALPWWGHLPEFKRLEEVGFRNIREKWPSLSTSAETTFSEEIYVSERCLRQAGRGSKASSFQSDSDKRAWRQGVMKTVEIAYKTFGNPDEGVFVVGVFPWKKPQPTQPRH